LVHRVVNQGWPLTKAAAAAEVSEPTARKWAARYLAEGELGLLDRPSAAHRIHNRTAEERIEAICALRRLRFTGAEIAEALRMPETTVSGILASVGSGAWGGSGLSPRAATSAHGLASSFTSTSRSLAASIRRATGQARSSFARKLEYYGAVRTGIGSLEH
jgi:hypothetical protein